MEGEKLILSYRQRRNATPYLYIAPTALFLAFLMLVPMVLVIRYAMMDNVIVNQAPKFVGLQHFRRLLGDSIFHRTLANTLYFTVMSITFHFVVGMIFALLLNSVVINRIARGIFRVFYIVPWMFTATITAIIWRLILNPAGIVNFLLAAIGIGAGDTEWFSSSNTALHALTFVNIWAGYPFYMVSLLAGLQGVPADLYEAATIDGANTIQRFFGITIPQLAPIIVSIMMLDFIWTLHLFPLVWMTTGGGPGRSTEMLSTYTYKLAFSTYEFSLASASAVLIMVFSLGVALFYIRHQRSIE